MKSVRPTTPIAAMARSISTRPKRSINGPPSTRAPVMATVKTVNTAAPIVAS